MTSPSDSTSLSQAFQFRIATLFVAMIWVGLLCVGLRTPSPLWAGFATDLLLFAVLTGALVAVYRKGQLRAAAIGFVLFCGGWLVVREFPPYAGLSRSTNHLSAMLFTTIKPADARLVRMADPFANSNDPYPAPPEFANI